ncbi:MAG: tRNA (N(6)-L-threonylcarbamoyladenosine(37)-C(2))-methylthiotransferase MtaB [Bdellovibrionales bacterium]
MNALEPISFQIHTFGCKVNTYDSGLLQSRLGKNGFVPTAGKDAKPQVHVLNTCAVTREATREAVKVARRLKARNPLSLIVVTGCAAQVDTEEFSHVPGIDLVVANSHKTSLETIIRQYYSGQLRERVHKSNIFKKEDLEPGGGVEAEHTRAFLKIQDGCNSFCTFCVIPFARGKSRSLSIADIVKRVSELEAGGAKEVVLTGVHIGDYEDGTLVLEDLVSAVLDRTSIPRIRLTSLEPIEVTPRLLALYKNPRLCAHFHMSIQAANTKMLHDMKRKYTASDVELALRAIALEVPGSFVGMDVIAGFPGETDDEFLDTLERLRSLPWTRLHVFPYSSRPGTFAARRDDHVSAEQIKLRASVLRELSDSRHALHAENQIGLVKPSLALRNGKLLSRDFWSVELLSGSALANQEIPILIEKASTTHLWGRPV